MVFQYTYKKIKNSEVVIMDELNILFEEHEVEMWYIDLKATADYTSIGIACF